MTRYTMNFIHRPTHIREFDDGDQGFSEAEIARQLVYDGKDPAEYLHATVNDLEGTCRQIIWQWRLGGHTMTRLDAFRPDSNHEDWGHIEDYRDGLGDDGSFAPEFCPVRCADNQRCHSETKQEYHDRLERLIRDWDIIVATAEYWLAEVEGNPFPVFYENDLDIAEHA